MNRFQRLLAWLLSDVEYQPCKHVLMPGKTQCLKCRHVILWAPP